MGFTRSLSLKSSIVFKTPIKPLVASSYAYAESVHIVVGSSCSKPSSRRKPLAHIMDSINKYIAFSSMSVEDVDTVESLHDFASIAPEFKLRNRANPS